MAVAVPQTALVHSALLQPLAVDIRCKLVWWGWYEENSCGGGATCAFSSRARDSSLPWIARSWSIGHFENFWSGEKKDKFFPLSIFLLTILFMYFRDFNPITDRRNSLIKQ